MHKLKDLYDTSAQDLRFGIGIMMDESGRQVPVICIEYSAWPLGILEAIREPMRSGITQIRVRRDDGLFDLILATRERAMVQAIDSQQSEVIRFPSWDARLEGIEAGVLDEFNRGRERLGRFLLIIQTDQWAFEVHVDQRGTVNVGIIQPKSVPVPIDD